ncbi:Fur family transcriptional regulator [Nocardioides iriomotensis]|uniref:Transcriptional repressor n=1 Tax=Nocardioides iriomotensis TaxID=715784 RepID=A0A4Q5J7Q7_9ACTN|nr:Fur family transcriptional regulator [Nocardioides iriomotensis]RYU13685.1 transcriptional repressor [Nocardioides iriomotensis]
MAETHDATAGDSWRERLRASGHRLTAQRELVLQAVDTLGHATPDEVLAEVRKSTSAVSLSTVYRTLDLLEELGLVRHAHLHDRAPTYHSTTSPPHAHTVCRRCGRVRELSQPRTAELVATFREGEGFEVDVAHLTVFGTCLDCEAPAG